METTTASSSSATAVSPPSSSSYTQGHDSDLFSLDFLALTGMNNVTSPQHDSLGMEGSQRDHGAESSGPSASTSSSTTTRGRRSTATHESANDRRQSQQYPEDRLGSNQDTGVGHQQQQQQQQQQMDVDEAQMEDMLAAMSRGQEEEYAARQEYDAVQSALLQQQLQAIHMQSPLGFDINNPNFPLGQLFLSSPEARQALQLQQQHGQAGSIGQMQNQQYQPEMNDSNSKWQGQGRTTTGGMPTPGPSGEIGGQGRPELMSPMHLEMFARAQGMDMNDPNVMPLLSPALSQHTSTSYASPNNQVAFSPHSHRNSLSHSQSQSLKKSPIEQLQEQQKQFQEQLASLQQQQLEMQATAAAVIAASTSPHIPSSGHSSTGSRPATTPGITPSPGIFSPLTSPALEATNRVHRSQGHSHQHFSPAFNGQSSRPPHPLSALSSPALNPVGSSGGAQQTLSPALGPQNSGDLADPDYLRALVGMMENNNQSNPYGDLSQPAYTSPSMASTSTAGHNAILASPSLNPISGPGPHRHSLPSKSRPSPMLKPTGHRSHNRNASTTGNGNGNFSVPTSPNVQKYHSAAPGMGVGYLPPSAIEHRQFTSNMSNSTTSTPSPVDLSHIMPPPPVPNGNVKSRKGVTPITPASLMNLGPGTGAGSGPGSADLAYQGDREGINQYGAVPPPPSQPSAARRPSGSGAGGRAVKAKQTVAPATNASVNGGGARKGAGNKTVSAGGVAGKRALAIRPQGGVGVRAATKAAAAAAAAASQPTEPETRKTSHKAAEQKRRDSLKAGFDELRLLLPPINTEALDAETGEPIPGSSAPRLLPKSSLVPDDNPNRGVSKVALLRFGNEYIEKLKERVERRDDYIEKLRDEIGRLRSGSGDEEGDVDVVDLLEFDWRKGEDEEFDGEPEEGEEDEDMDVEGGDEGEQEEGDEEDEEEDEENDDDEETTTTTTKAGRGRRSKSLSNGTSLKSPALRAVKRPGLVKTGSSSSGTVTLKGR
ncbi:hypothetical protein CI109_100114 [Kwoniella shandongensis]|uniref:Uncharacterized protein n=1 Tax=Kwoniella shandongensis TaxID=1734106 RepID=A0A5M6BT98_9TREE|nr:uncharacterized protein CI109_006858 [Kwoniella shandongensis]KAA5524835.1 hypothetical protein CI109_006858 [Kwoniella shandongensis]